MSAPGTQDLTAQDLADLEASLAEPSTTPSMVGMPDDAPSWDDLVNGWDLFVGDAVWSAGIAGVVLGFLSVYVVLRRMVFVSAAITQGAGLGVALAFYAGIHWSMAIEPRVGATVVALGIAAVVARDWSHVGLTRETVLGLLFALASGLAVVVGSKIAQEAHDVQAILFGTAVVVEPADLRALAAVAVGVMAVQLWWYRGFTFASFDPLTARVHRLPVTMLDVVLLGSIALVVAQAASTLGAMPAFALSTMPGVAARLVARGPLAVTFAVAAVIGGIAGVGGYLCAFFWELPVGASQTVTAAALVVVAVVIRAVVVATRRVRARRRSTSD